MSAEPIEIMREMQQGTPEWLSLRTTKITSTDAAIIMGVSHWKTKIQLYKEKIQERLPPLITHRMNRGLELEPIARDLFCIQNEIHVFPCIVMKDWAMASLDGMSACREYAVEIKCPGEKDHAKALEGKVPDHYYPQVQHQLYVTGLEEMFYYSFDGTDGVTLTVKRDEKYIQNMVEEEYIFYQCLVNKIPPDPSENDYLERDDDLWQKCASEWKCVVDEIKSLEKQEEDLRSQLIFLSAESNTKGGGISLCHVNRKGNVDYSKIPELKNVNLDIYRKPSSSSWRITQM
jgi:putative phage-type endonuclease